MDVKIDVATKEAEMVQDENVGVYIHIFRTPYAYEGRNYETLTFDFDKLTGNDALAIEEEMQANGKPVIVPTLSGDYLVRMAARACTERVGVDFFGALPIREYQVIRNKARSFLLKSEL